MKDITGPLTPFSMDFFQLQAEIYERCPEGKEATVNILGLAGETGELIEKFKKHLRDDTPIDKAAKMAMAAELGDILWYVAMVARDLDFRLSEIATINLEKLQGRAERDTLAGSGDNR